MAKEIASTEAKTSTAEPKKAPEEKKFPYAVLAANCVKLFGVTSSTFAGATIGKEEGTYTVSEMKGILDSWMKKPVKTKKEDKK